MRIEAVDLPQRLTAGESCLPGQMRNVLWSRPRRQPPQFFHLVEEGLPLGVRAHPESPRDRAARAVAASSRCGSDGSLRVIHEAARKEATLNCVRVNAIDDLVALDCEEFTREWSVKMAGTMAVHPDQIYKPFQDVAAALRGKKRRGIAYPSARHSHDQSHHRILPVRTSRAREHEEAKRSESRDVAASRLCELHSDHVRGLCARVTALP